MKTRRVMEHKKVSIDREELQVVVIYEPGVNKEQAKAENRFSKRHKVLVPYGNSYDYLSKRA